MLYFTILSNCMILCGVVFGTLYICVCMYGVRMSKIYVLCLSYRIDLHDTVSCHNIST